MHFAFDLQYYEDAKYVSHIDIGWYTGPNETQMNYYMISRCSIGMVFSPHNGGEIASSNLQSENLAMKTSPARDSRQRIIVGESNPTYILNLH